MLIGQDMDHDEVRAALKDALITDDELSAGPVAWTYTDPYADGWEEILAVNEAANQEHEHGHEHGH